MSAGRHLEWKLVFRFEKTFPGQLFTCCVQSRYPFKGSLFKFKSPASFAIESFLIGKWRNQLQHASADTPVTCISLHDRPLLIGTTTPGLLSSIIAVNIGTEPADFLAELYGRILVSGEDETPRPMTFEGPPDAVL